MAALSALIAAAAGVVLAAWAVWMPGLRSKRGRRLAGAGLVIAAVAIAAASRLSPPGPPAPEVIDARPNPFPPTSESLALGARMYREYCQACHGEDGHGDGPLAATLARRPIDFWAHFGSGHTHPDGRLYFWITYGMPGTGMPAFGDRLTDVERWHVVNFIKTFTPVDR